MIDAFQTNNFSEFYGTAFASVIIVLSIAFIVMGLVEAYKHWRRSGYHRDSLKKWMRYLGGAIYGDSDAPLGDDDKLNMKKLNFEPEEGPTLGKLEKVFAHYAARYQGDVVYRLPRQLFLRVIENTAQIILETPQKYEAELYCLARGAEADDRITYIQNYETYLKANAIGETDQHPDQQRVIAAIESAVERNLDSFQLALSQRWLDEVRAASVLAGLAVGFLAFLIAPSNAIIFFAMLFFGLIGGFTAMLMHDLFVRFTGKGADQI